MWGCPVGRVPPGILPPGQVIKFAMLAKPDSIKLLVLKKTTIPTGTTTVVSDVKIAPVDDTKIKPVPGYVFIAARGSFLRQRQLNYLQRAPIVWPVLTPTMPVPLPASSAPMDGNQTMVHKCVLSVTVVNLLLPQAAALVHFVRRVKLQVRPVSLRVLRVPLVKKRIKNKKKGVPRVFLVYQVRTKRTIFVSIAQ